MEADRFREILDLLEASLDEPQLAGGEVARRASLSRFHFDRLVRAALDEPPGAFRRRILLERAAHRLGAGGEPVSETALGAGDGGPEASPRAFARAYGAPPSAFRSAGRRDHRLPAPNGI